jgi:hypothetical protein
MAAVVSRPHLVLSRRRRKRRPKQRLRFSWRRDSLVRPGLEKTNRPLPAVFLGQLRNGTWRRQVVGDQTEQLYSIHVQARATVLVHLNFWVHVKFEISERMSRQKYRSPLQAKSHQRREQVTYRTRRATRCTAHRPDSNKIWVHEQHDEIGVGSFVSFKIDF